MSQLFICHTQYNLILATGLSFREDELVLFMDFNLTEELRKRLESHFSRCLFLIGNFPKKALTVRGKLSKIVTDNRALKNFIGIYDRIFIVDDMCIQEMYALKCVHEKNKLIEMAWLEDGANAYFTNSYVSKGMGATPFRRFIRKILFSVRFGLYGFYDLGSCMGAHKCLKSICVCFPRNVREELANKERREITDEQLMHGMEFMYKASPIVMEDRCVLIALDLLSVYADSVGKVNEAIADIVAQAKQCGRKVYCKYHPRETEALPALADIENLDAKIGIESYLINTVCKNMTVVGFKSTALQIAKKMGFEVVSLVRLIDNNCSAIVRFYTSIGIECR